jgi:transposase
MVDDIVDASVRGSRIDFRTGVGRRRRWSDADKGRIVGESFAAGAVVSEVARRHEMTPQHLFAWRKAARSGRLVLPSDEGPMFVPIVTAADRAPSNKRPGRGSIEIAIAGAVVHAEPGVDLG